MKEDGMPAWLKKFFTYWAYGIALIVAVTLLGVIGGSCLKLLKVIASWAS